MARKGKRRASTAGQKSRRKLRRSPSGKFAPGTAQGPGRGPRQGAPNAGRPPNEFKAVMRALASRAAVLRRLRYLTSGTRQVSDETFLKALAFLADRGYGRPIQELQHAGVGGGPLEVNLANVPDKKLEQVEQLLRPHLVA